MTPGDVLLVERWRDGDLAASERRALEARLAADPAFAAAFAAEARWQGGFGALLEEPALAGRRLADRVAAVIAGSSASGQARLVRAIDERIERPPTARRLARRRARGRPPLAPAAVLAAMAAALALLVWQRSGEASAGTPAPSEPPSTPIAASRTPAAPAPLAVLVGGPGTMVLRADGSHAAAAVDGTALITGDAVRCGSATGAQVRFGDGSELTLAPASSTRFPGGAGKVVIVEAGELHGIIAKQSPGAPMLLESSSAVARVLGTRLGLRVDGDATTLEVEEGAVAFAARASPLSGTTVRTGESARVHGGTLEPTLAVSAMALWRERAQVEAACSPTPAELGFRAIPWQTAIGQARQLAQAAHAPILVWVGWGTPLGACDPETLELRRRVLADARLQAEIRAHCVPLAVDCWRLRRRNDADGIHLLDALDHLNPHAFTKAGLYLLDAELAPIARFNVEWSAAEVAPRLDVALHDAHAPTLAAPSPWRPGQGADAGPTPPAQSLLLRVDGRQLVRQDGVLIPDPGAPDGGMDRCWLAPSEWRELIPDGESATLPEGITLKLARQLCVDHTRNERGPWPAEALRAGSLVASRARAADGAALLELRGHLALADGARRCEADLAGTLVLASEPGAERIADVRLVGLLRCSAEEDAPERLVGLSIAADRAEEAAAVPPCGMRDLDYFATP